MAVRGEFLKVKITFLLVVFIIGMLAIDLMIMRPNLPETLKR